LSKKKFISCKKRMGEVLTNGVRMRYLVGVGEQGTYFPYLAHRIERLSPFGVRFRFFRMKEDSGLTNGKS